MSRASDVTEHRQSLSVGQTVLCIMINDKSLKVTSGRPSGLTVTALRLLYVKLC